MQTSLSPFELTTAQTEALRKLAHLGSSDAVRSLSRLLGTQVEASAPRAQVAPRGGLARVLPPESSAFAVRFTVDGGAKLRWAMHVSPEGAALIGGLLLGRPGFGQAGVLYESALAEMSNIVVSSYLGGVASGLGVTLIPSIPFVGAKGLAATLEEAFGDLETAVLLTNDLRLPGVRNAGRLLAAPEDSSLGPVLRLLGVA